MHIDEAAIINIFFIMFGWYSPNIESFQTTLLIAFYWKLTAYAQKDKRMSLEMENVFHMENKNE